jgi:acetyl-CoA carboxylase biotin carboxyl carrier protein
MDLKYIEKLMSAMGRSGMKRIVLKQDGFEIELERECSVHASSSTPSFSTPSPSYFAPAPQPDEQKIIPKEDSSSQFVTSPMVGTFYFASSPDHPPFVKLGDEISENSVVCIIEAMKVMNEVKAGVKGKIVEILVKNGDPVEFGTKIFRII